MADAHSVVEKCKDAYVEACVVAQVETPWVTIAALTAENVALKAQLASLETKIVNAQAALA